MNTVVCTGKRKFHEAFPQNCEAENSKIRKMNENVCENDKSIIIKSLKNASSNISEEKKGKDECKINSQNIENSDSYNKDLLVDIKKFYDTLCKCNKCLEVYKLNTIEFIITPDFITDWSERTLIEDEVYDEAKKNTEENQNIIKDLHQVNIFNTHSVQNLSVEKVI